MKGTKSEQILGATITSKKLKGKKQANSVRDLENKGGREQTTTTKGTHTHEVQEK
eukprot:EC784187.1.p4 GENE.EC784187.1~~EC784187.1.p4  ORF type:complete len:55 (-),score=5.41 EC784187.1:59-223(-)